MARKAAGQHVEENEPASFTAHATRLGHSRFESGSRSDSALERWALCTWRDGCVALPHEHEPLGVVLSRRISVRATLHEYRISCRVQLQQKTVDYGSYVPKLWL